jgi:hypothetical protein
MKTETAEGAVKSYAAAVEAAIKRRLPELPERDLEALVGELVAMPARAGRTGRPARRRLGKIPAARPPVVTADPVREHLSGALAALEALEAAGLEERLAGIAGAGLRAARALAELLEREAWS